MVRISSGRLKGRKVVNSKIIFSSTGANGLRPTASKVREAIFNIVQAEIENALFLDLYAGTGAVGLEAISRGAEKVFFIENSRHRAEAIMDAIHRLNLDNKGTVFQEKAETFLQRAVKTNMKFDIIFADPPYLSDEITRALPYIADNNMLKGDGCILIEHSSKIILPDNIKNINLIKNYKYGDTTITLYRRAQ